MGKTSKTVFFCNNCGYESTKWMGQCPGCKEWNTFTEEVAVKTSGRMRPASGSLTAPALMDDIVIEKEDRITTDIEELDRVLGGGLVAGSLTLVGGDPGIGKSTLLLQVCRNLALSGRKILYISGEESLKQIKLRGIRIGEFNSNMYLLSETVLSNVEESIRRTSPEVVVIDSIQTMYSEDIGSAPGSVSQVREATAQFLRLAKGLNVSIFIVGHVTKEGTVAGPRVLEHMVDTVLYFEGDKNSTYRILRGVKNRFGSTNEIGVFRMEGSGLTEVKNPSEYMLSGRPEDSPGSVVVCSMEGTRPMLLEIQALVCHSNFGIPRRQTIGVDFNRVNLLMAVLERRVGLKLSDSDAYVNIVGGMKLSEPALDLGISLAIISSFKNKPISDKVFAMGEIGLSGEVRAVSGLSQRVNEGIKLGFATAIVPSVQKSELKDIKGIKLVYVSNVTELVALEF